jgi:hypothetical protein
MSFFLEYEKEIKNIFFIRFILIIANMDVSGHILVQDISMLVTNNMNRGSK